ncbi:MAG: hypothetical protein L6Q81_17740 [Bacteroidia bacterium]|nr:hypothetical protein [Bacteroidia bacterium]
MNSFSKKSLCLGAIMLCFALNLSAQIDISGFNARYYAWSDSRLPKARVPRKYNEPISRIMMNVGSPTCYVLSASRISLEDYNKRERSNLDHDFSSSPDTTLYKQINASNFVCADNKFKYLYLRDKGLVWLSGTILVPWAVQFPNVDTALILENCAAFSGQYGYDFIALKKDGSISVLSHEIVNEYGMHINNFKHEYTIGETNKSWVRKELVAFSTEAQFLTIACNQDSTYIKFYRSKSVYYSLKHWKCEYEEFGKPISMKDETFTKAIGMSPDNQYLYYINGNFRLVKLNVTTGKRELVSTLGFKNVEHGKVISKKPYVFMETPEYCVMFDAAADSVVYSITKVTAADITNDGATLIAAYQGRLMKFDGFTGKYMGEHTFSGGNPMGKYRKNEMDKPQASYIDKSGNWCVIGDDHIKVFNKTDKKELKSIPLPQERMYSICVLDNGRIVSGYNWSGDSIIIFYPEAPGKTRLYPVYQYGSYNFSDQGNYFLSRHPKSDTVSVINLTTIAPTRYAVIPEIKGKNYFHPRMLEAEMKVVVHGYGKYYGYNLTAGSQFEVNDESIDAAFFGLVQDIEASEDSRSAANVGVYRVVDNMKINNVMQYGTLVFRSMQDNSVILHKCHNSHLLSWSMSKDGKLLTTTGDEYYTGEYTRSKIWRVDRDAAGHLSFTLLDSIGLYKPREETSWSKEVVNPINKTGPATITRTVLGLSPYGHTADIQIIDYYENGVLISSQADAYRTQEKWYPLKGDDRRINVLEYPMGIPLKDGTTGYVHYYIYMASFEGIYYFQ